MTYQTKVRGVLLCLLLGAPTLYFLTRPAPPRTEWKGSLTVAITTSKTPTNHTVTLTTDDSIEVGLRDDGVVVWRKNK
jgi:hypothetical protein